MVKMKTKVYIFIYKVFTNSYIVVMQSGVPLQSETIVKCRQFFWYWAFPYSYILRIQTI